MWISTLRANVVQVALVKYTYVWNLCSI